METNELFRRRKSVRNYTGKLSEAALRSVIDAAQLSPVGMGRFESVHLTVIQNALLNEIDRNAGAAFGDTGKHPLYGAPCLILVSAKFADPANGNVPYSNAAILAESMALAAIDANLGSCLIWGAVRALNANPALVAKLNLPDGFVPCCGVIVGETSEKMEVREISNRIAVDSIK